MENKWICLECWKKLVAKPGERPPVPTVRLICDECGAQKVLVIPR
jgi:DNA-directed RNA polymerase subunit RPC12/RpoP